MPDDVEREREYRRWFAKGMELELSLIREETAEALERMNAWVAGQLLIAELLPVNEARPEIRCTCGDAVQALGLHNNRCPVRRAMS